LLVFYIGTETGPASEMKHFYVLHYNQTLGSSNTVDPKTEPFVTLRCVH